jgi:Cu(I)/Ag(I) efflux system protein CusF
MKVRLLAAALMAGVALTAHAGEAKAADHKTHAAVGVVKKLDAKAGVATIAHEPVKSANMPAMTMDFKADKAALGKLGEGKKVEFEFMEHGKDYVITKVK